MDEIGRRISALSPRELEEFDHKLRGRQAAGLPAARQASRRSLTSYSLSFAQERLWFLDQFQPGVPIYNVPTPIRFPGPLNIGALEQAVTEILHRHESLRTIFPLENGKPVQRICAAQAMRLPLTDLRDMPAAAREAELQRLIAQETMHVFDLARGPLFRALLICVDDFDHILVVTTHHIVFDGWSSGVLLQELGTLYQAFAAGRPSPLADLPLQYADYAQQQREQLQGERLGSLLGYWKQAIEGAPAILEFPTDRPRPAAQSFRGAWQSFDVGHEVSDQLKALARREGMTLFMTLLSVFDVLLFRYTGQRDIVVGTPIANRNRADIERLIGFFVNTLVIRTRLDGTLTFRELLSQVRETTLGAYAHQDLPFEKLVEEMHPDRTLSHNPLFQIMFVLQNAPTLAPPPASGAQQPQITLGLSKFDLTLSFVEHSDALCGTIEYNTDLFDHTTITRMIGHLDTLLSAVAADPDRQLHELPLLTERERDQILVDWNSTSTDYPADACVHEIIEAQVDRTPDAQAVVFEGRSLTYRELDQRANRLAHSLRDLGVAPEVRVGLCVERSIEMIVGVLAILKAGGAYLPLDPAHPKERIAYMIADAQAPIVLTLERFATLLPAELAHVVLDRDWDGLSCRSDRQANGLTPSNALAVFYTSGSTGQPKGSVGHIRGFINLFHWYRRIAEIGPESRVLLMTPFAFDASFKNMVTPLMNGGTVVLAGVDYDTREIARTIVSEQVTTTFATPSFLYQILEEASGNAYTSLSSMKTLFVGGEPTDVKRLRPWLASPACCCRIIHIYGPSECSDVSTIFIPTVEHLRDEDGMPIGRPIQNTKAYVLDSWGGLLPIGAPGELCISGTPVGRGYLNQPSLTAERFVPNAHGHGERLYRTGDRVRWLASGDIEFLGRVDHQVKIRGIRVELPEIETALARHVAIRQVVVLCREDVPGQKRLVAYVTSAPAVSLSTNELRRHLKAHLPDYMIPSAFVILNDMPLSSNGKIDRDALPTLEASGQERQGQPAPPHNAVEEVIALIWSEVLSVDTVGVDENFFELGGHSLTATQVVSRVRDAFQLDLPIRRLFEASTIVELSDSLVSDVAGRASLEAKAQLLLRVANLSDAEVEALSRPNSLG